MSENGSSGAYTTIRTNQRGRPRKVISREWLQNALSAKYAFSISEIARLAGVDRKLIQRAMRDYNLVREFSSVEVDDLDNMISTYKLEHPNAGYRYIMGWFNSENIKVQRSRVLESLRRIDALGHAIRNHATIDRQKYVVPSSNCLWHMDGHHKLIKWGVVLHGIADGFCRSVSFSSICLLVIELGSVDDTAQSQ